jgi:hypothetical protein
MMAILATVLAGTALAGVAAFSVIQVADAGPGDGAPPTQSVTYDAGK